MENRMTFLIETLCEVKKVVGENYSIIVSLNMDDLLPEGVSKSRGMIVEETIQIAQALEERNLADGFHLRIGNYYNQESIIPSAYVSNERYKENIRKFKAAVTKPVIFENKLSDPHEMQQMMEDGILDFVSLGRSFIAEPDWVNKTLYEKPVKPCLRCNYCLHTVWIGKCTSCAINPGLGYEFEGEIQPARTKKKVVVIGGGPGGIEAALTANQRGHEVILLEKESKVGGKLDIVGAPSYKRQYHEYLAYLENRLKESGVMVCCNTCADAETIDRYQPDAVILAIGAEPVILPVKGMEYAVSADDVLRGSKKVSGTVVIAGGGLVGCETAHVLSEKGCQVHIVEMQDEVLKDASYVTRHSQLDVLMKTGAQIHVDSRLTAIEKDCVRVNHEGMEETIKADNVVLAVGYKNTSGLFEEMQDLVEEVYQIGDCKQTGKIADAVREAYIIAKSL